MQLVGSGKVADAFAIQDILEAERNWIGLEQMLLVLYYNCR